MKSIDKNIIWIIGHVDSYGAIHHHIVYELGIYDSHIQCWPTVHHGKWRWKPSSPNHINTYNEELDPDSVDKIWKIIDFYKNNF